MTTEHYIDGKYGKVYLRIEHKAQHVNKLIILCHGITYSSEAVFMFPIEQKSFVDHFVADGFIVITFDIVGFGKSSQNSIDNKMVNSNVALDNLLDILQFSEKAYPSIKKHVLGWSWGAQIVGKLAMLPDATFDKVVLYGLPWHINHKNIADVDGGRRTNTAIHALSDFSCYSTTHKEVFNTFAKHALAINPTSPNGPLLELKSSEYLFNPSKIEHTSLVIHGNEDIRLSNHDARHFFDCIASKNKHYIVMPGSHALHLEKNHIYFINNLLNFLNNY